MHMTLTPIQLNHWTNYLWVALTALWLGFMPLAKPVVYRQPPGSRFTHIAPVALGLYLLFGPAVPVEFSLLNHPAFPTTVAVSIVGLILVLCGIAFSIWARIVLDGNWSGAATIKQDHTFIRHGPYRMTRHPIYTGVLLALLGSAVERGLIRSFLAVLLCALGLSLKIAVEENLMVQRFGEEYLRYRREVPALAPFLF